MGIIITSLNQQSLISFTVVVYWRWWVGGGGWGWGGLFLHTRREKESRLNNTWERPLKDSSFVPSRCARRWLFWPRCAAAPCLRAHRRKRRQITPMHLVLPSLLQALTLCRVFPPQVGIHRHAKPPAGARRCRSGFVSSNRFTISRVRRSVEGKRKRG